jgi:CBS domain-containing protein
MEARMKVREIMTREVYIADPNQSIRDAAQAMYELDAGALPVGENDRLVGMITDRDIAVRGIAEGKGPDTPIRDVMTQDVRYCFEDEDTEHVAQNMGEQQIRRIPVLNRDKRLIGILSLGDLATRQGSRPAGEALVDVSQPGGLHNQ